MGYLRQPHTSAGRVPTEEGYRFFVSAMMDQAELPQAVQNTILHQFYQAVPGTDQWMHLAASVLAHQSHVASLVTAPRAETPRFQHVELISTQGRQILMVLVMVGGEVIAAAADAWPNPCSRNVSVTQQPASTPSGRSGRGRGDRAATPTGLARTGRAVTHRGRAAAERPRAPRQRSTRTA